MNPCTAPHDYYLPRNVDRKNLQPTQLQAILASEYALEHHQAREAFWYGFYSTLMHELSRIDTTEDQVSCPVFFPQFPITADALEPDDGLDNDQDRDGSDDDDGLIKEEDRDRNDDNEGRNRMDVDDDYGMEWPSSPTPMRMPRNATLTDSPDELDLISKPESNPNPSQRQSSSSSSQEKKRISAEERDKWNSTRTPDFVRRRFYLDPKDFSTIGSRIDLIIELKGFHPNPRERRRRYTRALNQVKDQAMYAFQEDKKLSAMCYIVGIGNIWEYGELLRPTKLVRFVPPKRDGTWMPDSSPMSDNSAEEEQSPRITVHIRHSPIGKERAAGPSPPSMAERRLQGRTFPRVFNNVTSDEQKGWLSDVKARLDFWDSLTYKAYLNMPRD